MNIQEQGFRSSLFGFDKNDVLAYMNALANEAQQHELEYNRQLQQLQSKLDELRSERGTADSRMEALKAELAAATQRADTAEAKRREADEQLETIKKKTASFQSTQRESQKNANIWQLKCHDLQQQVDELQNYITENALSSTDIQKLTDWTRSHRYNLLELYRDQVLIYSSYAPRHYYKNNDPEAPELTDSHQHGPFYDWSPVYTLNFSDGKITALLYYNGFDACYSTGCDLLLIICLASFPLFFLWGSRGIVKYIVQLSEEIQAMEGGDLDHPITVQGSDELTTLASSLDSMRLTLRQQHEDEAAAAAKVKNLITEMSHDLRTPLTTLLLYTEILRHRKYETTAQAEDYLSKIDTKARQLKQLSDNLFEYALVTRDTVAVLDPPARFSQIFEEPLTEMVGELQERGFACALELGEEDDTLTVKEQYVRRILDNITSNLLKYADPAQDISVRFVKENGKAGLAFENAVLPGQHRTDSTKVGLTSIETMMEKMHAECRIEQSGERFCITLLFPITI